MAAQGLFDAFNPQVRVPRNQHGLSSKTIQRGSLISFHYPKSYARRPNIIHDPYPMVIITDVWPQYIRGVNLHYITFPFIKNLLQSYGGNQGFSYYHIKPTPYVAEAFRMYVRVGIRKPRKLDTAFLLNVLGSVRSIDPSEVERVRRVIQSQIQQRLQAKADELQSYENWRASLTRGQQGSFDRKVRQVRDALQGGYQRDLVRPEPPTGPVTPPPQPPPATGDTL